MSGQREHWWVQCGYMQIIIVLRLVTPKHAGTNGSKIDDAGISNFKLVAGDTQVH